MYVRRSALAGLQLRREIIEHTLDLGKSSCPPMRAAFPRLLPEPSDRRLPAGKFDDIACRAWSLPA
jgi:hypothetical protein